MGFSYFWVAARALTAVQKVKITETRLYLNIIDQYRQHVRIIKPDNFPWPFFIVAKFFDHGVSDCWLGSKVCVKNR